MEMYDRTELPNLHYYTLNLRNFKQNMNKQTEKHVKIKRCITFYFDSVQSCAMNCILGNIC